MRNENRVRLRLSRADWAAVGRFRRLRVTIAWAIAITLFVCTGILEAQTTQIASDDFNRPDGPIGTNWSSLIASEGTFYITNDTATSIPVNEHTLAYWSSNSFSPDQYSQAKVTSIGPFSGVILRADSDYDPVWTNPPSGSQFYMGFVFAPNDYRIYHYINNAYYPEFYGTEETWVTNDIIGMTVSGSVEPLVTMYRNGNPVLMWLVNEAGDVKTNGNPGLCMYSRDTDPLTIDDWEGGNLNPDANAPTVPVNLTATAVSANQINLNWNASTDDVGVAGYLLERSQGAGSTNFILLDTFTGTSYDDNKSYTRYIGMYPFTPGAASLLADTTYNYRLRATDAEGNFSGYSAVVTATTFVPPVLTISPIPDQTTLVGISVGPFPFYLSDPGVDPSLLSATASSSNTNLVPNENLVVVNVSGTTQALVITPTAGQAGTTTITITASNGNNSTNTSFLLTVNPPGNGTDVFANPSNIVISAFSAATPYPSTVDVSGEVGTITKLTVTLQGMSDANPGAVNVLLVGPGGQAVVLMSDTVGAHPMTDLTFTLSDQAYYPLPCCSPMADGTFQPADYAPNHTDPQFAFPSPAPGPPFTTTLGTFNGLSPNGTWSLYVSDGAAGDSGQIAGGWSLAITTVSPPTISGLTNQSTPVNTPTAAIPFEIQDAQTPASNLVLTATSSDLAVVDVSGITITNQTITLTPQPNVVGTTTINVIVTDSDGMSATNSFLLTVAPGQLTVAGITASDKPYDGTSDAVINVGGASLTGQGLLNSGVTLDTSAATGAFADGNVGTNKLVQIAGLLLIGTNVGNYVLTQPITTASITPAVLTYVAVSASMGYGSEVPGLQGTVTGFQGGDNLSNATTGTLSFTTTATPTSPAGSYPVAGSGLSANNGNYTFVQADGNATALTVTPAGLLITAQPQTISYGATVPATTVTYSGFVNGDTATNLTTQPTIASAQTGVVAAGSYPDNYTATGAVDPNYLISYVAGSLTVHQASLTITAQPQSITYGTSVPATTVAYEGFVNGDTAASLTTPPSVVSGQSGVVVVGIYPGNYSASGAVDPNYSINYVPGDLDVGHASLTITAQAQSITYGTSVPATTVSYSGFVNGDTASSLTTPPTISSAQSGVVPAGTYPDNYTVSGAVADNYTITYHAGTLVVNPLAVLLTGARTYDGTDVATNTILTVTNAVGSDEVSVASGSGTLAGANVGTNTITSLGTLALGGATATNYTLVGASGSVTILPAALTIAAQPQTITYGTSVPSTTVSYSGFVNGDTASNLTTQPTIASVQTGVVAAGSYPGNYTASGAVASNYAISYVPGDLTVGQASLTITAQPQTITYGATVPPTTVTYSGFVNGDTASNLTTQPTIASAQTGVVAAGSYPDNYTATGAVDPNYLISYVAGALTVTPAPQPSAVSILVGNGTAVITFAGTNGVTYVTQSTTNLTENAWIPISTNTPGQDGGWVVTNSIVDEPQKFYRALIP
jgi:hypothetical protein